MHFPAYLTTQTNIFLQRSIEPHPIHLTLFPINAVSCLFYIIDPVFFLRPSYPKLSAWVSTQDSETHVGTDFLIVWLIITLNVLKELDEILKLIDPRILSEDWLKKLHWSIEDRRFIEQFFWKSPCSFILQIFKNKFTYSEISKGSWKLLSMVAEAVQGNFIWRQIDFNTAKHNQMRNWVVLKNHEC